MRCSVLEKLMYVDTIQMRTRFSTFYTNSMVIKFDFTMGRCHVLFFVESPLKLVPKKLFQNRIKVMKGQNDVANNKNWYQYVCLYL